MTIDDVLDAPGRIALLQGRNQPTNSPEEPKNIIVLDITSFPFLEQGKTPAAYPTAGGCTETYFIRNTCLPILSSGTAANASVSIGYRTDCFAWEYRNCDNVRSM